MSLEPEPKLIPPENHSCLDCRSPWSEIQPCNVIKATFHQLEASWLADLSQAEFEDLQRQDQKTKISLWGSVQSTIECQGPESCIGAELRD